MLDNWKEVVGICREWQKIPNYENLGFVADYIETNYTLPAIENIERYQGSYTKTRKKAWRSCFGLSTSRLYACFNGMHERCLGRDKRKEAYYKKRGIKVCDEWQDFLPFAIWSLMHNYSEKLTLDRIAPSNCRWVDRHEQRINRVPHRYWKSKYIYQFSKDGLFIGSFTDGKTAAKILGCSRDMICKVCRGEKKSFHGFRFSYERNPSYEKVRQ